MKVAKEAALAMDAQQQLEAEWTEREDLAKVKQESERLKHALKESKYEREEHHAKLTAEHAQRIGRINELSAQHAIQLAAQEGELRTALAA